MPSSTPDLRKLDGIVSDQVIRAMKGASSLLSNTGIRHALVGALAVGAYGYPRASKDVDFMVGDEAFEYHEGGIVTLSRGVPIQIGSVPIDSISIPPEECHLVEAIRNPATSQGIPIVSAEVLVYLKLKSPRRKDSVDILELLMAGLDEKPLLAYLKTNAASLVSKFETLWHEAQTGE